MIRPLLVATVAMVTLAPAQAGEPVPPARDIRAVEARLEPARDYHLRADRFVPVVVYVERDDPGSDDENFEAELDGYAAWESGR